MGQITDAAWRKLEQYDHNKDGAVKLLEDTSKNLNVENVSVSYKLIKNYDADDDVKVTVKSPHLKYYKPRYREGGDSVLLGIDVLDEYVGRFHSTSCYSQKYQLLDLIELMEDAEKLNCGEEVVYRESVSEHAATSVALNGGFAAL